MIKQILKHIVPSLLATLFTGLYVIIDGLFIGQKLGPIGLAAINIAWPVASVIQATGVAIGMASGIMITTKRAMNKEEEIPQIFNRTFVAFLVMILIIVSIYFYHKPLLYLLGANSETIAFASTYLKYYLFLSVFEIGGCMIIPILRNFEYHKSSAMLLIIATIINAVGDYVLIYVFNLELAGAAMASVIAEGFVFIGGLIILIRNKNLKIAKKINIKETFKLLYLGIAPFILTFSSSFIIIFYNLFCVKYGGNLAVAAYTVVAYIIYVPQCIAQGTSDGLQPMLTYSYNKEEEKVRPYFLKTLLMLSILLIFLIGIFYLAKNPLASLFNINNSDAFMIYNNSYWFFIGSFIFIGISRLYISMFYATYHTLTANLMVLLEPILTPICLFLFSTIFKLELLGIWFSFLMIQIIVALICNLISFISYKKTNKKMI